MPTRDKVLITGSSGMLGVDLCNELREGCELFGLDVTDGGRSPVDGFYKGDITDRKAVADIVAAVRPRVVIHTAAWTDVDGCEADEAKANRVNGDGAGNVAAACKKAGAVMICISTDFVFDGAKKTPYTEDDAVRPLSVYAASKLKGEEAIRKELTEHFILRTSWLYGRHGKNFVDTIVAKAKTEKHLKVVDDQVGSPTYTVDLAKAIHALLAAMPSHQPLATSHGVYHVSNAGSVSWYGFAQEIVKLVGSKAEVTPITSAELNRPARRPAMSVLDNTKFTALTGYRMRGWQEALKDYLS